MRIVGPEVRFVTAASRNCHFFAKITVAMRKPTSKALIWRVWVAVRLPEVAFLGVTIVVMVR